MPRMKSNHFSTSSLPQGRFMLIFMEYFLIKLGPADRTEREANHAFLYGIFFFGSNHGYKEAVNALNKEDRTLHTCGSSSTILANGIQGELEGLTTLQARALCKRTSSHRHGLNLLSAHKLSLQEVIIGLVCNIVFGFELNALYYELSFKAYCSAFHGSTQTLCVVFGYMASHLLDVMMNCWEIGLDSNILTLYWPDIIMLSRNPTFRMLRLRLGRRDESVDIVGE
ncbi:hypothetical protein L2E82_18462 [Cichorium intybus]|uniref:Uncharacterized protein n=1 Tax=Cichorium intybus TaxID=13427 RepID=A0ACB9FB22_CICIN|nr:hypothetical protein L2E82_18462 [Cichorium intybus]